MMNARMVVACVLGIALGPHDLEGQTVTRYRDFELKADLAAVSALTGVAPSAARLLHQRPSLLQDLEWRPSRWHRESGEVSTDPVEQVRFSFYDDQLFRIVVDYESGRTEGMTDADMIDAISDVYGPPSIDAPGTVRAASLVEAESGSQVARWGDARQDIVLYRRLPYRPRFRLIVTEVALEALARTAALEAARLDTLEAPAREAARRQKAEDDSRDAAERARRVNRGTFRP